MLIALVLVQATNATDAYSTAAVAPKPIPVGITTVDKVAIGFVNIAVPTAARRTRPTPGTSRSSGSTW